MGQVFRRRRQLQHQERRQPVSWRSVRIFAQQSTECHTLFLFFKSPVRAEPVWLQPWGTRTETHQQTLLFRKLGAVQIAARRWGFAVYRATAAGVHAERSGLLRLLLAVHELYRARKHLRGWSGNSTFRSLDG